MVELAGEDSPFKNSVDNSVLLVAAIFVGIIFAYFGYRMYMSITTKDKAKEERKLAKQQKKEKAEASKKGAATPKKTK